jgi:hypothetical protein
MPRTSATRKELDSTLLKYLKACLWVERDEGSYWDTCCNQSFTFILGSPKSNFFKFCPYCGKRLEELPIESEVGK